MSGAWVTRIPLNDPRGPSRQPVPAWRPDRGTAPGRHVRGQGNTPKRAPMPRAAG